MPDLIITFTATQASRVATAFGARQGLGRAATVAELKAFLFVQLKEIVRAEEKAAQEALIIISNFDPV